MGRETDRERARARASERGREGEEDQEIHLRPPLPASPPAQGAQARTLAAPFLLAPLPSPHPLFIIDSHPVPLFCRKQVSLRLPIVALSSSWPPYRFLCLSPFAPLPACREL